jgi:hypothetical protein
VEKEGVKGYEGKRERKREREGSKGNDEEIKGVWRGSRDGVMKGQEWKGRDRGRRGRTGSNLFWFRWKFKAM